MGKTHLHCGDFSACGRCGPTIRFTNKLEAVDCKGCHRAIEICDNAWGWRLKNPFIDDSEEE